MEYTKKECLHNSAIYKNRTYTIIDVNEEEQLFYLAPDNNWNKDSGLMWVRIENCSYIPF